MKNLKKAHEPYTPKPEATKYRFMCGSTKLVVTREGNHFFHEHPDGVTKELIGDFKKLAQELRSSDASWITRDEGRHYPKTEKVFFDRTVAMSLLRQGCSVYCDSLDTTIRFSDDYSHLIDLNCSMLPDLPASRFMRAFLEPCNEKTYHAVIVEKKEAESKEIARLQQEYRKSERQAEAEKSQLRAEKLEVVKNARQKEQARINAEKKVEAARVEIETLKADLEDAKVKAATAAKKTKKGFKYWLERAGYVLGGVALGVVIVNHKK